MDTERQIERVTQRAKRYWYDDGLVEMSGGVIFALIGLLFLSELFGPPWQGISALALPAVIIGGALVARRAVAAVKERLTYPRTGYVAYVRQRGLRTRAATAVVAVVVSVAVSFLIARVPAALAWMPALQGLVIAAALFYSGYSLGLGRFLVLAVVSAVAGVGAALAGLGDVAGSGAYFLVLGLAMFAAGGYALRRYLYATGPAGE